MRKMMAILLLMWLAAAVNAQEYRFEAGGALGMSGYLGDANNGNMWKKPGYVAGGVFRYIINSRMAIKANLLTASLSGNSADIENVYPDGAVYDFSSQIYDLGAQFEFNFLNFGIGSRYLKLKRISPYLTMGMGLTMATGDGDAFTLNIPLGVGVKYKIKERLNVALEFTMRKSFSDKLDGLTDINGISSGFAKNTDWYSVTMVTLTYEFSKRCRTCHYVE
ncbi:MAG: DUF6089 family protein [Muribaculaceae bacterium]